MLADNFGDILTENSSTPIAVDVNNMGTADLTLSCHINGRNPDQFRLLACASPVNVDGSTAISVVCEPVSVGSISALLSVSTNDVDESEVNYILTCSGIGPPENMIFFGGFEGSPVPHGIPDLIVISPGVTHTELTPHQSFTISATVRNQGDEA